MKGGGKEIQIIVYRRVLGESNQDIVKMTLLECRWSDGCDIQDEEKSNKFRLRTQYYYSRGE